MNEHTHPQQGQPMPPEPATGTDAPVHEPHAPHRESAFTHPPAPTHAPDSTHSEEFAGGMLAEAMRIEGGEWIHPQLDEGAGDSGTDRSRSSDSNPATTPPDRMNHLLDLHLPMTIELGRTDMSVAEILELDCGSIVELDRMAGEPVDLLINNQPVAKGEVVVIDDKFGIRITQLVKPGDRIASLRLQ